MKTNDILNAASRGMHRIGFKIKKASPEIMIVAGVAGIVTSAVMACKATTKAGTIKDELKEGMDQINEVANNPKVQNYTEEDKRKDTVIVYTQAAMKYIKLYGPSVLLGAASIACIIGSHNILRRETLRWQQLMRLSIRASRNIVVVLSKDLAMSLIVSFAIMSKLKSLKRRLRTIRAKRKSQRLPLRLQTRIRTASMLVSLTMDAMVGLRMLNII